LPQQERAAFYFDKGVNMKSSKDEANLQLQKTIEKNSIKLKHLDQLFQKVQSILLEFDEADINLNKRWGLNDLKYAINTLVEKHNTIRSEQKFLSDEVYASGYEEFPYACKYGEYIVLLDSDFKIRKGEHRFLIQKHLDRELSKAEIVHHKDGNKLNNDLENLEVMDRKTHYRKHH